MSDSPARKPWWRRWFGSRSERAAVRYLKRQGFRVVRRNYTCPHGEIDVVAVEGDTVTLTDAHDGTLRLSASDPEFVRQMGLAEDIIKRYRNTLRELAK